MGKLKQAGKPFVFYTRLNLSELTGLRAGNLEEMVHCLSIVPGACIYHHTHRFLEQHQCLSPEPPNDFAYWVTEVLEEKLLGEKLASVDTIQFTTLEELRQKIIMLIENHLSEHKNAKRKFANSGQEFHFIKSISFVSPTGLSAYNLKDFVAVIKAVSVDSLYYHIFEARLRLERETNDFSFWLETSLGEKKVASKIAGLDPYTHTMEGLRGTIINLLEKRLAEEEIHD